MSRRPAIPSYGKQMTRLKRKTRAIDVRWIPKGRGMDLGYEYQWGIEDDTLGFLSLATDGSAPDNPCMDGSSVATLQGQGDVTPPQVGIPSLSPQGSFISGNASYRVTDQAVFAGCTELRLMPTWAEDPQGTGPYIDWTAQLGAFSLDSESQVGHGMVWKTAESEGYPFICLTDGHYFLRLRMIADGSLITATNPITFEDGDVIQAFWTCFVNRWD